jgi:primosomal protein N' (replication factor Y)
MFAAVYPLIRTRAFSEPFDYAVPEEARRRVRVGALVVVPLGSQRVFGLVVELRSRSTHAGQLVPLLEVVDLPAVPPDLLELAEHLAAYYVTALPVALALVAPPTSALRIEKRLELTEAGRAALKGGETSLAAWAPPQAENLADDAEPTGGAGALASRAPAGATQLSEEAERTGRAPVTRYRRRGWLRMAYRWRVVHSDVAARLCRLGAARPPRLGARQKAALDLLAAGPLDERTLRRQSGLSAAGLSSLAAAGAVVVADEPSLRVCGPLAAASAAPPPELLPAQGAALAAVLEAAGTGGEVLLHGVTGSGKTEVYLRAAAELLARGRSVLFLVPEIGLTGQTISRLCERFPDEEVAVLHSGISAGERLEAYRAVGSGRARIVIGARSAVFAPLHDLGLIVIDEEHDPSYKQENEPRYDARTIARWRAQASGAVLVLGSATPSVEAFARVTAHADLESRVDGSQPPDLEIIDMRGSHGVFSPELAGALTHTIEAGEKAILFLNRRGYAAYLVCEQCGHTWTCPRCDVTLTLFGHGRGLRCRICGHSEPAPGQCAACGSADLARFGFGTERLEREVALLLPGVELLRLDSDVASSFTRLQAVLDRFAAPGAKVLVGTQMIAKGHHFPEVTLVGVVNADLELHFPDFRAEERTFAMLVQVGGRSGRGERPGRVLVQTLDPQARAIARACAGEGELFYAEELERRRLLGYPPATTLVALELSSTDPDKAAKGVRFVADKLLAVLSGGEVVLGPGPLRRERGRYASRVVVKSMSVGKTIETVSRLSARYGARFAARGARLVVDVEPQWL